MWSWHLLPRDQLLQSWAVCRALPPASAVGVWGGDAKEHREVMPILKPKSAITE